MAIDLTKVSAFSGEQTSQNGAVNASSLEENEAAKMEVPEGHTSYKAVDGVFNTVLKNGTSLKFTDGYYHTNDESIIEELEHFVKIGAIIKAE